MTIQGTASAAGTSATIPSHQIGDLLMIFVMAASATPATKPTASGTVPNWTQAQTAGANSLALTSAWFIATANNHTSGTWTGAAQICTMVLRPAPGSSLNVATSSVGAGTTTQTIVYPALTLSTLSGTSFGVRCGTRTVAVSTVATAPTNWTNRIVQPAGASALMAVHTRSGLTANPTADTVTTSGTNATYRAHTLEISETTGMAMIV